MRVFLVIAIIALLALSGVGLLMAPRIQSGLGLFESSEDGTAVRAEKVKVDRLVETVSAPGDVEPRTKVDISAEVSARIEELPFREGDAVKKGAVIIQLDGRDLQAGLDSARARRDGERFRLESERARLAGLESTAEFALRQMKRQEELFRTGDVPSKSVDDSIERYRDLQAGVDAARHSISVIESSLAGSEADIKRAEEVLQRTVVRAPMDGVVTKLNAEVGELVVVGTMNNAGTVIMTIADLSRMIMRARVAESDITRIEAGQKAKLHINAYDEEVFHGTVRQVALQRTRASGVGGTEPAYFEVEIDIELGDRWLRSGLAASTDIELQTHEGIIVPSQAIVERLIEKLPAELANHPLIDKTKRSTMVVYRIIDGRSRCTPVRAGASDLTHSLVLAGLEPEETVIVGPYKALSTIEHDTPVQIESDTPAVDTDAKLTAKTGSPS